MPDEADVASAVDAVVDGQNQPTPDAPAATDGQGTTETPADAEQGYLRHSDYTRKTQELAEQRREIEAQQEQANQLRELAQAAFLDEDPDAAAAFLELIGYGEDEGEADYGQHQDPEVAALRKQLDEVNSFIEQQKQESEQRSQAAHIDSEFMRLTGEAWNRENPDHEAILAQAAFLSPEEGNLDMEAGYKAFGELKDRIIQDYREGKTSAASPTPLTGTPAQAALPEDPEARVLAILEAHGH